MKEIETLKKTILTQQDIDILAGIAIICTHDALQADVNLYGKIFALISNCDNDDDIIKIESTIKAFAGKWKKDRASDRVFNVFNARI